MRLAEVYTSVQGEGPNTGDPTTFVRFGGCNLRCQGWGFGKLPDGTEVPGCDTVFAVYPEWNKTWDRDTVEEVLAQVPDSPQRVCITGGEPLLQPKREVEEFVRGLLRGDHTIDLFTNGSFEFPDWVMHPYVTVVTDWKMPGSGEFETFNVENLGMLNTKDAVKFVCKDRADFDTALECARTVEQRSAAQRWFGAVWGQGLEGDLAEWVAAEYPEGKLNIQTHKFIWPPEERRR